MKKPNLFVVGAPKSGTSFLFEKLKRHKDIFMPETEELNFFSKEELSLHSYYSDYKINSFKKYIELYKTSEDQKNLDK